MSSSMSKDGAHRLAKKRGEGVNYVSWKNGGERVRPVFKPLSKRDKFEHLVLPTHFLMSFDSHYHNKS